jgi:hypothetical protein
VELEPAFILKDQPRWRLTRCASHVPSPPLVNRFIVLLGRTIFAGVGHEGLSSVIVHPGRVRSGGADRVVLSCSPPFALVGDHRIGELSAVLFGIYPLLCTAGLGLCSVLLGRRRGVQLMVMACCQICGTGTASRCSG